MLIDHATVYPESDGEPMTDKDINRLLMEYAELAIRTHFRGQQVYVSANLFIYYQQDEPNRRVAPDVFVVKGVEPKLRERYLLWEEGVAPCVAFEFTSRSSRFDDPGSKMGLYALLGIQEYYLFDPTGEFLNPRFRAYRLQGESYVEVQDLHSPELGLDIQVEGQWLRFIDPITRKALPTADEAVERADRLQAELDALRRRLGET